MEPKIIIAMDHDQPENALALANQLDPHLCRLKVGKGLFTLCGPRLVEDLMKIGFEIFLDLKFHDIPKTVEKAVRASAELGVWMLNVHASGGVRMMEAARDCLDQYNQAPLLIAVTLLTSLTEEDMQSLGIPDSSHEHVLRLASLAYQAGCDGVVCSAQEATQLRGILGESFILVTPGIRPSDVLSDDQRRIMTPKLAIEAGANYLVVGRPITQASDPLSALMRLMEEIKGV